MRSRWLAGLFVLLAGCSRPKLPTVVPERVAVAAVGPSGVDLVVDLGVDNPNGADLTVREVTAKVLLDGRYDLGAVTVPQVLTLPAHKRTPLSAPLHAKWGDMAALIALAAAGYGVPYDVDGTVRLGGEWVNAEVPYHLKGTIEHDQMVRAAAQSLPRLLP